ncbi:hypothetical protein LCGC14_2529820, partial [marine sediment metagenome]
WDWRAQGFLPGQAVTIYEIDSVTLIKGDLLGTFEVTDITDDNPLDTFDNTELRLDQLSGDPLALGDHLIRLEAADDPVMVTLSVTFVGRADIESSDINEEGGTITRSDAGDWKDDGFAKGQLLLIDGLAGSWRIIDVTTTVMTVRGNQLSDGTSTRTLSVAGRHGGLTVVHGGGNFALELDPKINLGADFIERRDGLDWQDDGYAVGQFVTIEGLAGAWQITDFEQVPLVNLSDDIQSNPFQDAGTNSKMVLDGLAITPNSDIRLEVAVVNPFKAEASGTMSIATSSITRNSGDWFADDFYVGQHVYVSGLAGPFTVSALTATVMTLQNVALTPQTDVELDVFGYDLRGPDVRIAGPVRMGGDHITVTGGAGPDSPLVVYGDTSQDGVWYSGSTGDVRGYEFGDKPFDPFVNLPDGENENDEWVFPLADPYQDAGDDIIDARLLFAGLDAADLPTIGFVAYGGEGNDVIYGSQTGDHLAGGSGDDEIH